MQSTKMLVVLLATLALPASVLAQANVIENETANVYVDQKSGSDVNPGTQTSPFLTIAKGTAAAAYNNIRGIGTKVLINPGTYREVIKIEPTYRHTSAPITLQATQTGTAIIAGSDILANWNRSAGNPSIYTHAWTYNFGFCPIPSGWPKGYASIVQRKEMIFVNGMPLTQVMSLASVQSGTFYVDETAHVVNLWPSKTANMTTAVVEAAARPETLVVNGRTNIVLRGLVFEHAASCMGEMGANIYNSTNILLDSVQASWNSWGGLGVSSSNRVTVRNSVANHNGGVGFTGFHARNTLYQLDESDYNNWRGAMGAFYDWGMGGTKFFASHSIVVDQMHVYRNQAQGLWFDTDNKNISITNSHLVENQVANLQLEQDQGPISLANTALCSGGVGMILVNAARVTATGNIFYNNGGTGKYQAQVYLGGRTGGRAGTDWETGQAYDAFTEDTTMRNNAFADAGLGQFVFATYLAGYDWNRFANSLSSNNNKWSDSTATKTFLLPDWKMVDLRGWQGSTGEDMGSSWEAVNAQQPNTCAVPGPVFPDFSLNVDNHAYSMVAGTSAVSLMVHSFAYGEVVLSVSGLPTGVLAAYSQPRITSGDAILYLIASPSAVNQTIPITLIANRGSRVHTVTVSVHVIPPLPAKHNK